MNAVFDVVAVVCVVAMVATFARPQTVSGWVRWYVVCEFLATLFEE